MSSWRPPEIFIHTKELSCGQGGKTQKDILGLWVDIRRGLQNFRCGNFQCTDRKASNKIDTQKRNDQLISIELEKSSLETMHPKINLAH
jgi:hypothetical protein